MEVLTATFGKELVALKRAFWVVEKIFGIVLRMFPSDAAFQLDVLRPDGDPLGLDGTKFNILELAHQVGIASLLQHHDSTALEAQVDFEGLRNLTHQVLK